MNKKYLAALIVTMVLSGFLSIIQFRTPSPPCFNADEAAFAYNSYSLLKTGRDEYGTLLPLRLKSFGDYKMPLYSYASIPFIAVFGLNEMGARSLNVTLSLILPVLVYVLTYLLFHKRNVGLIAAFLVSVSLGLHIVSRHAHEAYLATVLSTLYFTLLIYSVKKTNPASLFALFLSLLLLLFSYHPGRLIAGIGFVILIGYFFYQNKKIAKKNTALAMSVIVIGMAFFLVSDLLYSPERIKNLLFFSHEGLALKVNELRTEGGILRKLYHPSLVGLRDVINEHLSYYSPQFLIQNGDLNDRFGYRGMGLMTSAEYVLIVVGLYFLFRNREWSRFPILTVLLLVPLSASLSWSTGSLTRTLFLFIPLLIVISYGITNLYQSLSGRTFLRSALTLTGISAFALLVLFNWDFYLFHYPKRLTTIHAWQCGYRELGAYVRQNYNRYNRFYVTRDKGMPYIFLLFYLQYDPAAYQREASLSGADEYGFGQVDKFDKFIFSYIEPEMAPKGSVIIGSRDNVIENGPYRYQEIAPYGEPMFRIIEPESHKKRPRK